MYSVSFFIFNGTNLLEIVLSFSSIGFFFHLCTLKAVLIFIDNLIFVFPWSHFKGLPKGSLPSKIFLLSVKTVII